MRRRRRDSGRASAQSTFVGLSGQAPHSHSTAVVKVLAAARTIPAIRAIVATTPTIFGVLVSLRNIALHIVPGTGSYGDAVFGFHLYTWAFLVFMAMIVAIAVVMFFQRQFDPPSGPSPKIVGVVATIALIAGIVLAAANTFTTAVECEWGACPDSPTKVL